MILYVFAALAFIVSVIAAIATGFNSSSGSGIVWIRLLILLLGIAIAGVLIWLARRKKLDPGKNADGTRVDTAPVDDLLREANRKLAASPRAGAKQLRDLPILYVLGESGSAKTTTVLKSGLEPELLAGSVYRERDIVPTAVANIWYSGKAAVLEMGEAIRQKEGLWTRLILQTRSNAYRAAFKGAPFRAAVVCLNCEQFMGAQTNESMQVAAAAQGARLRELARQLGIQVPTYVLLTKLDRVPGFNEYVRNLSADEGKVLLGAAPKTSLGATSLTADDVGKTFDELLFGLGVARLDILARESDLPRLGPAYEFPRELRRFRNLLSTYLAELVRPSHLDSNPQLRGFYLTGVRAIMQQQVAASPQAPVVRAAGASDATGVFSIPQAAPAPLAAPSVYGEKVAQWTFLPHFYTDAVLGDSAALAGTSQTGHGRLFRRLLYGGAAALLLVYLLLLTISYFSNAALEHRIETASRTLANTSGGGERPLTTEQLQMLDGLRGDVVQLEDFRAHGAPLRYRWGLYRGDLLLTPAREAYFAHFRSLLLSRTQASMVATLSALPQAPGQTPEAGADYTSIYATLRAYLITTSNPDKSTVDFLAPQLLQRLQKTGGVSGPEQLALAERQFSYYAALLPTHNPYSIAPSVPAVSHARKYLSAFGGFERIYQGILTAAEKSGPAIRFNTDHPRSAETVVEPHTIIPAFTQSGYAFMQDALANPGRYFSGEAWVLGDQAPQSIDAGSLKTELTTRYLDDYLREWRAFVKDASVVRYTSLQDAGNKLGALSSNDSPLLALFYTVSRNTSVPNPQISNAFQAPQAIVPAGGSEQYIGTPNKAYVDALLALNAAIKQATQNPAGASDPAAAAPVTAAANAAHLAAQQAAQAFHVDSQAHLDAATLALLEAPITGAESLVRGLGPAQANAGGKSFCSAYNALLAKSPFNPKSSVQATPAEVSALLQPGTGSLWQLYNANLKTLLVQQGPEYVAAPNAPMQVNAAFVKFFNRAVTISQEFFPTGSSGPTLSFVLRNVPSSGIQSTSLKVDAQTLTNNEAQKQFTWSAQTAAQAGLTANSLPLTFSGTWAVFDLFNKAHSVKTPAGYELSFPLEVANTAVRAPDGTPLVVRYELSGPAADVLAPGGLATLRCVSEVSH